MAGERLNIAEDHLQTIRERMQLLLAAQHIVEQVEITEEELNELRGIYD